MSQSFRVGLNQKRGLPAYGSYGASCELEVEFDLQTLLTAPEELEARVRAAFALCRKAVEEELVLHADRLATQTASTRSSAVTIGEAAITKHPLTAAHPARRAHTGADSGNPQLAERSGVEVVKLLESTCGVVNVGELTLRRRVCASIGWQR